ncbi:MAG: glycosyltransferase family 2 protein, partial [Promethearchaeota archaeon]
KKIQIVIVISGSNDDSASYCEKFANQHQDLDIEILSDPLDKKGKPAALNYGVKHVKHKLSIFYDSGITIQKDTLAYLVAPIQDKKTNVSIGATSIENWNYNKWTRGAAIDYTFSGGGDIFLEVKNALGSSGYVFGRNFCIKSELLRSLGGFNEDSLTEDLYLTVILNLNGEKVLFAPQAKAYDLAPTTWNAIKQQRQRWVGGYSADAGELMEMKKGTKSGAPIIISRNLSMLLLHHIDDWVFVVLGFVIFYSIIGFYYLLSWTVSLFIFQIGYLFNGVTKYGDKHYSLFLWLPICAFYIHLYMLKLQFSLPDNISWEKTPMILERGKEEREAMIKGEK